VLLYVSLKLPKEIEIDPTVTENQRGGTFKQVLKQNCSEVWTAIKEPPFHRTLLYLALTCTIPSFGTFGYYFMLDVVQLSKQTIALLNVLGYISLFFGSALFNSCLAKKEFRTLCLYNIFIGLLFTPLTLLFATR
jgi:hypothetical protein